LDYLRAATRAGLPVKRSEPGIWLYALHEKVVQQLPLRCKRAG
jgi:hypothetical protein